MKIDILTLFPKMCESILQESIIGRAIKNNKLKVNCHQIRDFATDKHHRVDDTTYGGGMGMVFKAEPIARCFENICQKNQVKPYFIYMSPQGNVLNNQKLKELSKKSNIAILCGHYEGVDQRVLESYVDEEISIGDYVLTGGELPALVLIDSLARLIPGVLSSKECYKEESIYSGLLEYPQYTKPAIWRGIAVPEVLLSGHHANINKWRTEKALEKTAKIRPDLLK